MRHAPDPAACQLKRHCWAFLKSIHCCVWPIATKSGKIRKNMLQLIALIFTPEDSPQPKKYEKIYSLETHTVSHKAIIHTLPQLRDQGMRWEGALYSAAPSLERSLRHLEGPTG